MGCSAAGAPLERLPAVLTTRAAVYYRRCTFLPGETSAWSAAPKGEAYIAVLYAAVPRRAPSCAARVCASCGTNVLGEFSFFLFFFSFPEKNLYRINICIYLTRK